MILTFKEIQRRVGARLSNTSTSTSEDNDILPKIKDWINERYERIYRSYPWRASLDYKDLTIVLSQNDYALDRVIGKIHSILDVTNGRLIKEDTAIAHDRFRGIDLDISGNVQTGDPTRYWNMGLHTVKAEISTAAEKIKIVSTATADLTPNVVGITGLVGGAQITEQVVLTGTSAATSTNTFDASQKLKIAVGTSTGARKTVTGVITVTGNTSTTVMSVISPTEIAPEYQWIRVSKMPKSSGTQPTWTILYSKRIVPMTNDLDIPIIDVGIALIEGAVSDGLREDGQDQIAEVAEQRFINLVGEAQLADDGPNLVEQFIPDSTNINAMLDFGRTIGV